MRSEVQSRLRVALAASLCVTRRSPATHCINSVDVARFPAGPAAGWVSSTLWLLSWIGVAVLALVLCVLFMTAIVPVAPDSFHSNERTARL